MANEKGLNRFCSSEANAPLERIEERAEPRIVPMRKWTQQRCKSVHCNGQERERSSVPSFRIHPLSIEEITRRELAPMFVLCDFLAIRNQLLQSVHVRMYTYLSPLLPFSGLEIT